MKKSVVLSLFLVAMILLSGSGLTSAQAKSPVPGKPTSQPTPAAKARPTSQPWAKHDPIPALPLETPPSVAGELIVGFSPDLVAAELTAHSENAASSVGATILRAGARGMTLMKMPAGASASTLTASLKNMPGVSYVEPNYTVQLVDSAVDQNKVPNPSYVIRSSKSKDGKSITETGYPVSGLKASKTKTGSVLAATYPNDPTVWTNWGWSNVGADIVWNNTTPSKNVCLIDTGVDYLHPDLAKKVIKGFDFVNYDADPMDDYGQGTMLAGIIAAGSNNKQGIVGVSTGKVVAVKVIDANGASTAFDIAQGIYYCADRSDVNVLSLSMNGPYSVSEYNAVDYAVNQKNKLLVAAAGDQYTSNYQNAYPAAFVLDWPDRVLAVAASGLWWQDGNGWWHFDQNCQAELSNYGSWVNFVGPGTDIYSTTPWDKYFTLNQIPYESLPTRYGYRTGTSLAAPFVAAAAARAWGYLPYANNYAIEAWLHDNGMNLDTEQYHNCYPASMSGARLVNVAAALERGALTLGAMDANTDLSLVGATVSAYDGATLKGSAIITYNAVIDPKIFKTVETWVTSWADIINLPAPAGLPHGFLPKINLTNYTVSAQPAFVSRAYNGLNTANGLTWTSGGYWGRAYAAVPQKSAMFTVVGEALGTPSSPELVGWLPPDHPFIVNPHYAKNYGNPDVLPYGSMSVHPFARWLNYDWHFQSLIIRNRPGFTALPYYSGTYDFAITDGASSGQPNMLDYDNTAGFIWKDGVLKYRVDKDWTCDADNHWWYPFAISFSSSGSPSYQKMDNCSDGMDY